MQSVVERYERMWRLREREATECIEVKDGNELVKEGIAPG